MVVALYVKCKKSYAEIMYVTHFRAAFLKTLCLYPRCDVLAVLYSALASTSI